MSKPQAQPRPESKSTVPDPKALSLLEWRSLMDAQALTPAIFTRHELDLIRKVCRDSDYEDASKVLARALQRGDGR